MDFESDDLTSHLADTDKGQSPSESNSVLSPLTGFVNDQFIRARDARLYHEQRWLQAYRNYRGVYGPDTQFREGEKSRVFVKITKTKVLAAHGQILEVLFSVPGRIPLSVEAPEKPTGVAEAVYVDPNDQQGQTPSTNPQDGDDTTEEVENPYGYVGDGKDIPKGSTWKTLLGPVASQLKNLQVKMGFGQQPQQVTIEPAEIAARKMDKTIQDQLGETDANSALRNSVFECSLLGTGAVKGPFTTTKYYNRWNKDDKGNRFYDPIVKDVPCIEAVSIWNIYPDPDAKHYNQCEYVIERHMMSRAQLRKLKDRPFFRDSAIDRLIDLGPNYVRQYWETELVDKATPNVIQRWEVLEYWGTVDRALVENSVIDLPDDFFPEGVDNVQMNVWVSGSEILRCTINPLKPQRIPYWLFPYEINPYQPFGIGVGENMEDCQMVMNGHVRMAIDNLALSGNIVFEVDETNLVPGQDMTVFPGKMFRRQGGAPGQSIFATKFQNTTQENLMMYDKFRQFSDEATGIQSYSYGQTGVQATNRTASGMSMLMGASALNIKTVIKNIDDYLLRPLGEALFAWNMQFNPDDDIKGNLEIKARGTSSLMQKEVRSQRLTTLMQTAGANPALAPLVKWRTVLREYAQTLDIDPEKFINNPDEATIQAMLMSKMNGNGMENGGGNTAGQPQQSGQPGGMGGMGQPPPQLGSQGNGGGNIGTGAPAMPGEASFAANNGQNSR